MKRVYVNEEWCLGCRLCEYNCAFAKSGMSDIVKALRGKKIFPRIMLMYGKVSQENYVELTAASAIPNKEIKSPQILRY